MATQVFESAKDFLGNDVKVGDIIAVAPRNYRGLVKAKVIKITKMTFLVEYVPFGYTYPTEYRVDHDAVIKVG